MPKKKPKVIIVRGHQVTPWELVPWQELRHEFDVSFLLTNRNRWDVSSLSICPVHIKTLGGYLPKGQLSEFIINIVGDRYVNLEKYLGEADIVHAEELSFWFTAETARAKGLSGCRYKLVQTIWETIPLLETYRHRHGRFYRRTILKKTDLFLATTERARESLLMEGVEPNRIEVCYPGICTERFAEAVYSPSPPRKHIILSPGRLVWEKGHQDVLRAVGALHRGVVRSSIGKRITPNVLFVGSGPEEFRLKSFAGEMGLSNFVEFLNVPYKEMPKIYSKATCIVLASLPAAMKAYHLFDRQRIFWEEQFGMVLIEGMASGLPIVASRSGAIPEVMGKECRYFDPGDWITMARLLADGPLSSPPETRISYPPELILRYSAKAAAERLAAAYVRVLS